MASNVLPRPVQRLIDEFARLPGVGPKSAARLTFYLLRAANEQALELSAALQDLKEKTTFCSICHNITEQDPCAICLDEDRQRDLICVVEEPLDVVALERSRAYNGLYHVLHGAISPVEGIGPEDLKIEELMQRLTEGSFSELIIATNATLEGDATTLYLQRRLSEVEGLRLTRLARGLSVGGDLEYTDEITITRALEGRQSL
ncbi:MAG: recombination mediator RecR [Chloroflexota bacterium]